MYSWENILNDNFDCPQHLDNRLVGPHISNYTPQGDRLKLVDQEDNGGSVALSLPWPPTEFHQTQILETLACESLLLGSLSGSYMTDAIVDRCLQRRKFSLFLVSWFLWVLKNHQPSFIVTQLKFQLRFILPRLVNLLEEPGRLISTVSSIAFKNGTPTRHPPAREDTDFSIAL